MLKYSMDDKNNNYNLRPLLRESYEYPEYSKYGITFTNDNFNLLNKPFGIKPFGDTKFDLLESDVTNLGFSHIANFTEGGRTGSISIERVTGQEKVDSFLSTNSALGLYVNQPLLINSRHDGDEVIGKSLARAANKLGPEQGHGYFGLSKYSNLTVPTDNGNLRYSMQGFALGVKDSGDSTYRIVDGLHEASGFNNGIDTRPEHEVTFSGDITTPVLAAADIAAEDLFSGTLTAGEIGDIINLQNVESVAVKNPNFTLSGSVLEGKTYIFNRFTSASVDGSLTLGTSEAVGKVGAGLKFSNQVNEAPIFVNLLPEGRTIRFDTSGNTNFSLGARVDAFLVGRDDVSVSDIEVTDKNGDVTTINHDHISERLRVSLDATASNVKIFNTGACADITLSAAQTKQPAAIGGIENKEVVSLSVLVGGCPKTESLNFTPEEVNNAEGGRLQAPSEELNTGSIQSGVPMKF